MLFDISAERDDSIHDTIGTLTKHKIMLRQLNEFKSGLYFVDVNDDLLARFVLFLIGKGLSNNYTYQSMQTIKGFFNRATKKGYNRNMVYQAYSQRFYDETKLFIKLRCAFSIASGEPTCASIIFCEWSLEFTTS